MDKREMSLRKEGGKRQTEEEGEKRCRKYCNKDENSCTTRLRQENKYIQERTGKECDTGLTRQESCRKKERKNK